MQVLHFFLALLLSASTVFSSTGVRISQHWCGNILVNATIWGDAEPCDHFSSSCEKNCAFHQKLAAAAKNCCQERTVVVEGGDEDYQASALVLEVIHSLADIDRPLESVLAYHDSFSWVSVQDFAPPPLEQDLQSLFQSYLI
jgi:hypothetical protein